MNNDKQNFKTWFSIKLQESHFVEHYPYLTPLAKRVYPVKTSLVEVMGICRGENEKTLLLVNTDYWDKNFIGFRGVLLHEILHLKLDHLDERFNVVENQGSMVIAKELSVNQLIEDEPMPDGAVTLQRLRNQIPELTTGQSTFAYYRILSKYEVHLNDIIVKGFGITIKELVDKHKHGNNSGIKQAGNTTESICDLINENDKNKRKDHLRNLTMVMGNNTSKSGSNENGGTEEMILAPHDDFSGNEELFETICELFINGDTTYTRKKVNRRFPDSFGVIQGKRINHNIPSLVVVIDTSGSMSEREFQIIENELCFISRIVGNSMTLFQCDTDVRKVSEFTGRIDSVIGRGNTDLSIVFRDPGFVGINPDLVIMFTDGLFNAMPNPGFETLWVLTKKIDPTIFRELCPWGKYILLENAINQ